MRERLSGLRPGESGRVANIGIRGPMRRRLLDIGLTENARVECVAQSPGGDPSAYLIRGAVIAIRGKDAAQILITRC